MAKFRSNKKETSPPSDLNFFPELSEIHFYKNGTLNKKGIKKLLILLRDKSSPLYEAFGEEGKELFLESYTKYKKNPRELTKFARNLIVAYTILFNEHSSGPDSIIVRQTDHLFSLLDNEEAAFQLRKLLLKIVLSEDDEVMAHSLYSSFMYLFLRHSSKSQVNNSSLAYELNKAVLMSRAVMSGVFGFDILYERAIFSHEKKKVLKHASEFWRKAAQGSFSSSLAVFEFFTERGYGSISESLQCLFSNNRRSILDISTTFSEDYSSYKLRDDIVHERIGNLRDSIKESIEKFNRRKPK